MPITIRDARPEDRAAILALVPRLRAFGPPPLRPVEALDRAEHNALSKALDSLPADAALIVAEDDAFDGIAGVAFMQSQTDYFTGEVHGHLGIIIVSPNAEHRGVGRALLDAVDDWARGRGYRFVTLTVFEGNERARRLYERAGYTVDTLRYVKLIGGSP